MTNKIFQKRNIPNILVVVRMILTIAIVVLLSIPDMKTIYSFYSPLHDDYLYTIITLNHLLAGILFVIASYTDRLDGRLARKHAWVSDFGKLWDPIADKVLINSVLICFAAKGYIPAWIPIIMIARDIAVDADRMFAASRGVIVAANIYGKAKTVVQMFAIIFIFFIFNGVEGPDLVIYWAVQNLLMYVACLLSLISGVIYFRKIHDALKAQNVSQS